MISHPIVNFILLYGEECKFGIIPKQWLPILLQNSYIVGVQNNVLKTQYNNDEKGSGLYLKKYATFQVGFTELGYPDYSSWEYSSQEN